MKYNTQIPLFHVQEVAALTSSSPFPAHFNLPKRGRSNGSVHHTRLIEVTTINAHRVQRCDAACFLLVDGKDVLLFAPTAYRLLVMLLEHLGEAVPFEELVEGSFDLQRDRGLFSKHMSAIRKMIQPLGLAVRCVTAYGYLIQSEGTL